MTLQDLTKKNQEFVHIATNQLLADGKSDAEIKAILEEHLPEIIDNQKKRNYRTLTLRSTNYLGSLIH